MSLFLQKIGRKLRWPSPRSALKWALPGVATLLAIIIGTVFRQNVEVFSNEIGADRFLAWIFGLISSIGISSYVIALFWATTGGSLALWADQLLKKRESSREGEKKVPALRRGVRIEYNTSSHKFTQDNLLLSAVSKIENIYPASEDFELSLKRALGDNSRPDPIGYIHRLEIEFTEPIKDAAIVVVGERTGIAWCVDRIAKTHVDLSLKNDASDCSLVIEVAENAKESEKVEVGSWYQPLSPKILASPAILLKPPISESPAPQLPQDTETKTPH